MSLNPLPRESGDDNPKLDALRDRLHDGLRERLHISDRAVVELEVLLQSFFCFVLAIQREWTFPLFACLPLKKGPQAPYTFLDSLSLFMCLGVLPQLSSVCGGLRLLWGECTLKRSTSGVYTTMCSS